MRPIILKSILVAISIILAYVLYSLVMLTLDELTNYFGRETTTGNMLESLLMWLSHFGFGLILLPLLSISVFYYLNKKINKCTYKSKVGL